MNHEIEPTELITWKAVGQGLPDSDQTVIVFSPKADEPVWLGFHDGETWRDIGAERLDGVTHWAQMPMGIKVRNP